MSVDQSVLELLLHGEISSYQLTPAGSNYTFLVEVRLGEQTAKAIYKPRDGEAPLWDFPRGTLYKRECAAYLLSDTLGWNFIPQTVIREGRHGIGSVQRYVEHDPRQNYYTLTPASASELRTIACFDLVANNTDRKAVHLLLAPEGKLWGIDHGLTFHADTKIRTVISDFSGEPIPEPLLGSLDRLSQYLRHPQGRVGELLALLLPEEVLALQKRVNWVLKERVYPGMLGMRSRR